MYRPEWPSDPKPVHGELRDRRVEAQGKLAAEPKRQSRYALSEPAFTMLVFGRQGAEHRGCQTPDCRTCSAGPIPNPALSTLQSSSITSPQGVAIESDGDVLVCTGTSIKKTAYGSHSISTVISGLSAPYRLDIDRSNGNIIVFDAGTSNQVKKYNSSYSRLATYGCGRRAPVGAVCPHQFPVRAGHLCRQRRRILHS